jgi:cytochrome c-type biogenesis protein CcmE
VEVGDANEDWLRTRARRRVQVVVAAAVVATGLGLVLFNGLDDATLYFRTADEAVAQKAELGTRRFRIEGVVVAGTVRPAGDGVDFAIEEQGVRVAVHHQGGPPELFQPDIPVVLEGRWSGERFASDRIMVKHTNEYRAEHPERVDRKG